MCEDWVVFCFAFLLVGQSRLTNNLFESIPIATYSPSFFRPQISDLRNEWVPR